MEVVEVKYRKTFNLGNYESESIEVAINCSAENDYDAALNLAKSLVQKGHDGKEIKAPSSSSVDSKPTKTAKKAPAEANTEGAKKPEAKKPTAKKPATKSTALKEYTLKEVQDALKAVARVKGSRDVPAQIVVDICGETPLKEADPKLFNKIIKECAKCLKS